MADTEAEKAFIFDAFILVFTFIGAIWTTISCASWVRQKLRPPEESQSFSGRDALMLEELYLHMLRKKDLGSPERMRKRIHDLHDWHKKEDSEGIKLWYAPRTWGEKIDKILSILQSHHPYQEDS